jgi:fatty-acyl-CoA synthase
MPTPYLCDQLDPWTPHTIGAALAAVARHAPDAEAVVAGGRRFTYGALHEAARRAASGLLQLGIRRGDHVAICMENSLEWVAAFYGCALIGAVVVGVNTRFKEAELRYCLAQSDAKGLVVADKFLKIDFIAMLRAVCPEIDGTLPGASLPQLRQVIVRGTDVPVAARPFAHLEVPLSSDAAAAVDRAAAAVVPDDVALIQYTSGTTADPKGVMLTHDNMLRDAANVAACIGIRPDDRYFSPRVFYHVAGTTLSILASLTAGACLVTVSSFDVDVALKLLAEERCTLISGNDTIFLMIFNHPRLAEYELHLRGGWAAAGYEVMRLARDRLGLRDLVNAYGLSEASPNVIMSRHDDPVEDRLTGVTKPHKGLDVRTVDLETGHVQPPGVPGEIQVRGWSIMKGYYNKPEETAKALLAEGWLRTGDLGVLDEKGRLRFIGRAKDMLRVGGENVAPADVEEVLHAHPKVKQAQIVGVPDARLTEVPAAYVVLKEGAAAEPDELIAWCRARCANFKVPRYLRIIDTFEGIGMTGSNKVQKHKLRAQALRDFNLG